MEWTDLHGRLLGRAFERVLGRAESGTVAFVRCLTPNVVAELVADSSFAPQDWQVSRVADIGRRRGANHHRGHRRRGTRTQG